MQGMSREDQQMKVRLPADLKQHIEDAASAARRSLNAEIVARLQASFDASGELPSAVRDQIDEEAERMGISSQDALTRLVLAGAQPGAPMVLYIKADASMTIEQYRALFEAAKEFTPPDATVVLDQGQG